MTQQHAFSPQELSIIPDAELLNRHAGQEYPDEVQYTVWENPTNHDVVLDLQVEVRPLYGPPERRPKLTREMRTGLRQYVIRSKERVKLLSEYDVQIQQTHCMHSDCSAAKARCQDRNHPKVVVGGLGPSLKNCSVGVMHRLAPALDAMRIEAEEAKTKATKAMAEKILAEEKAASATTELDLLRAKLAERERELETIKAHAQTKAAAAKAASTAVKPQE